MRKLRSILSFGAVVAVAVGTSVVLPQSADAAVKDQCLLTVAGVDNDNNFIIGKTECFVTYAEVLSKAGARNVPSKITPASADAMTYFSTSSIIGTHYEDAYGGGASMSVTGTVCNGGGLNVSWAWNDRISSTLNGCGTIIHYEHTNYGGSSGVTTGSGSLTNILGYMDNRTSSIRYFS